MTSGMVHMGFTVLQCRKSHTCRMNNFVISSLIRDASVYQHWRYENLLIFASPSIFVADQAQITQAVLFSSAIFCFVGRLSIRITTRKTLLLDDGILTFSAACLCGATAYSFRYSFLFYLKNATVYIPSLISTTAFLHYAATLRDNQAPRNMFACFNWKAIYAVKLCFFTFFKSPKHKFLVLTIFYWVSVVFTILAWFTAATSSWILPYTPTAPKRDRARNGFRI